MLQTSDVQKHLNIKIFLYSVNRISPQQEPNTFNFLLDCLLQLLSHHSSAPHPTGYELKVSEFFERTEEVKAKIQKKEIEEEMNCIYVGEKQPGDEMELDNSFSGLSYIELLLH